MPQNGLGHKRNIFHDVTELGVRGYVARSHQGEGGVVVVVGVG